MSGKREGMRPILLFGGTTEGRELAAYFCEKKHPTILCVATEYGREALGDLVQCESLDVRVGRLGEDAIEELIVKEQVALVVDATHPYAEVVTEFLTRACARQNVRRIRCLRPVSQEPESGVVRAATTQDAVDWLSLCGESVLLTTGSKELEAFSRIPNFSERVYARVLPAVASIEACLAVGLSGRHIIAMQGPFGADTNRSQLEEFGCQILVTKDTGERGGFPQKLEGAARAGAITLVIDRPGQEVGLSVEEVKAWYEEWRKSNA